MLGALATIGLITPVRSYGHGPQLIRQTRTIGLDLLQTIISPNAKRATINAAGDFTNPQAATSGEAFGAGALVGTNSVALGCATNANQNDCVVIGKSAFCSDINNVVIGSGSSAGDGSCTLIGKGANESGNSSGSILIGANTYANSALGAISIGTNATQQNQSPAAHECTFGDGLSASYYLSDWYPFSKSNDQSRTCTIHGPDAKAGTNLSGFNMVIGGSRSTGNAAGGYLSLSTAPAGTSGTTQGTLTERMRIAADGGVLFKELAAAPAGVSGFVMLYGDTGHSLAIGNGATIDISKSTQIAIGYNAACIGYHAIAIGGSASATRDNAVAIGMSTTAATSGDAIAIGYGIMSTGGIAIGSCETINNQQIASGEASFGDGRTASTGSISDFYPFSKWNTLSRTCTLHGPDSFTGTNQSCNFDFCIAGARGTGTGTAGKLKLQSPVTGSTGTTRQTLATVIEIQPDSKLGFYAVSPVSQQVLATGASHTVDDVITFLQTVGLCKQS